MILYISTEYSLSSRTISQNPGLVIMPQGQISSVLLTFPIGAPKTSCLAASSI